MHSIRGWRASGCENPVRWWDEASTLVHQRGPFRPRKVNRGIFSEMTCQFAMVDQIKRHNLPIPFDDWKNPSNLLGRVLSLKDPKNGEQVSVQGWLNRKLERPLKGQGLVTGWSSELRFCGMHMLEGPRQDVGGKHGEGENMTSWISRICAAMACSRAVKQHLET